MLYILLAYCVAGRDCIHVCIQFINHIVYTFPAFLPWSAYSTGMRRRRAHDRFADVNGSTQSAACNGKYHPMKKRTFRLHRVQLVWLIDGQLQCNTTGLLLCVQLGLSRCVASIAGFFSARVALILLPLQWQNYLSNYRVLRCIDKGHRRDARTPIEINLKMMKGETCQCSARTQN